MVLFDLLSMKGYILAHSYYKILAVSLMFLVFTVMLVFVFYKAGKPVRRSTAGPHLSTGPGNHGKQLLKGDSANEFQSHGSSRRSSGNDQKLVVSFPNAFLKIS